jgi:hypothetical protein
VTAGRGGSPATAALLAEEEAKGSGGGRAGGQTKSQKKKEKRRRRKEAAAAGDVVPKLEPEPELQMAADSAAGGCEWTGLLAELAAHRAGPTRAG